MQTVVAFPETTIKQHIGVVRLLSRGIRTHNCVSAGSIGRALVSNAIFKVRCNGTNEQQMLA